MVLTSSKLSVATNTVAIAGEERGTGDVIHNLKKREDRGHYDMKHGLHFEIHNTF